MLHAVYVTKNIVECVLCRPRDVYHTCYTLSGLSVAQHPPVGKPDVIGSYDNLLVSCLIIFEYQVWKVRFNSISKTNDNEFK